ncbi:hypothetical protein DFR56_104235 [Pseudogracilibacillus auburnensis]|uniref:Uncharacterized protein n=1 Tax=Pseudogracilibacillus auburnensis TaxID=1494959 RepID=A0A2V3W1Y1_9BACI|nr:hypothetical protein DFR56_104235 [Pseudogracilibacillus auburnensis]
MEFRRTGRARENVPTMLFSGRVFSGVPGHPNS